MGKDGPLNGFQMQNPDRKEGLRECFIARARELYDRDVAQYLGRGAGDECLIIDLDFSGLELCTVAQVCLSIPEIGYSRLAEALNRGIDPHLALGAKLLKISYEEALAEKHTKRVKNARQLAKIANFGFPGGLSAGGFVGYARGYGVILTKREAEELKEAWLETWPEFHRFFLYVRHMVEAGGGEATVRQLFSGRVRGGCRFTVACNTLFQGLGADGALAALFAVTERAYVFHEDTPNMLGIRPWNFVHDQILADVRREVSHEAAFETARVMVEACNRFLPDVPTKAEPALSKAWSKNVESVYDENQRLVAWDEARDQRAHVFYSDGKPVEWKEAA
jgi:DNA polymerase I-like protein with 3'-5' exonuclease and polymerase domains